MTYPVIIFECVLQVSDDGFQSQCLHSHDNDLAKHFSAEYQ